jgi:hypothetical protein
MARKQTIELAREEAMERVVASFVSKLLVLAPPWLLLVIFAILAAVSHAKWGAPPAVTWVAMAATLCTVILALLTWAVSHMRGMLGRVHSTATVFVGGLWFTIATITGIWQPVTFAVLFFGGLTLGIGWNIRTVIRMHNPEAAHGDALGALFDRTKETFGLGDARVRTTEATDYKIKGKMALPSGEKTADDVIKKVGNIESGFKVPPGTVQLAADQDNASQAHITITDPRIMRKPLPWPGPSLPGGSIAKALRPGLWQDMDPVQHVIPGHHLQITGMSGAGKTEGGAWNYLAEAITRHDVAIFAADLTKGEQGLGPFRPALHRFETTTAGVRQMLRDIEAQIQPRTDFLAARGYQKWVEGCGLLYWLIWLEEVPKILNSLGDKGLDDFLELLKALRSAGGSVVMSLQRGDWTQMPTLARSQLAKMCFGIESDKDTEFGLSAAQQEADARPELWANKQPGMAYLDAPSIPAERIAMPLRTFAFSTIEGDEEKRDRQARTAITAHAAKWPATGKLADEFTRTVADPSALSPVPAAFGRTSATVAVNSTGGPTLLLHRPTTSAGDTNGHDSADHGGSDSGVGGASEAGNGSAALRRLADAAEHLIATQHVDLAALRAHLGVDEAECLRILEALERKGVIGPAEPGGVRQVLVNSDDILTELVDDGDPVSEYLRTDDPSPDITAGPDTPISDIDDDPLDSGKDDDGAEEGPDGERKVSPEASRRVFHDWLRQRAAAGPTEFRASDPGLAEVRDRTGNGRGWVYKVIGEVEDAGVIERVETGGFRIVAIDRLDDATGAGAEQ